MSVDHLLGEIKSLRSYVVSDEARVIRLATMLARALCKRGVTMIKIRFSGIGWSYDDPRTPVRVTRRGFERRKSGDGYWEKAELADCILITAQLKGALTSAVDDLRDRASVARETERLLTCARDSLAKGAE